MDTRDRSEIVLKKGYAKAYTNIALIKYWGKKNKELILPMNNSLSLTLDAFYSQTSLVFDKKLSADIFVLNDVEQSEKQSKKVVQFMDLVREKYGVSQFARIDSVNTVPTAAGLASSASGFAALAGAVSGALDLNLSQQELSQLARRGSGSACRSIYGGLSEWVAGSQDDNSQAVPIHADGWEEELAMLFIILDKKEKAVPSRDGMELTVQTSCFYDGWLKQVNQDLADIKEAIADKDFDRFGQIAEANALAMHATTLGARPPFTYWQKESMDAMEQVRKLREDGIFAYFTMDAGPNVKVLIQKKDSQKALLYFQKFYPKDKLMLANSGPAIEVWSEDVEND